MEERTYFGSAFGVLRVRPNETGLLLVGRHCDVCRFVRMMLI